LLAVAAAALIKPLAKACGTLADEVRQAVQQQQRRPETQQQQQQQPPKGMRGGFLSAGSRQQLPHPQQPQSPAANLAQGLSIARTLISLWLNLVSDNNDLDAEGGLVLFSNAAVCPSVLPAVKLMLVVLQAQSSSNPAASSHTTADEGNEPWAQVQTVLAAAADVAQAVADVPSDGALLCKPGVMQLLTAPGLHQLLLIIAAWLTGLLHQQKQGRAAVHTASVVRSLSNSAAAASYSSDSSSSSSTILVEPHHIKVLELLGAPALDPRKHSNPASCKEAKSFCSYMLRMLDIQLPVVLDAAGFCLDARARGRSAAGSTVPSASHMTGPASSSCRFGSWYELVPALTRMLVEVVQLEPCSDVRRAALLMLMPVVRLDSSMQEWQQPAGGAAAGEMVVQLGPTVLHAYQQSQQQQQQQQQQSQQQQQQEAEEDAKHCQFALWYWAVAVMNTAGASELLMGLTLRLVFANCCRHKHELLCTESNAVQSQSEWPCSADATASHAAVSRYRYY
jgi:hypothetical protein